MFNPLFILAKGAENFNALSRDSDPLDRREH